ncbi:hypothetical protein ACKKBG_A25765 [Auxenochlorella protothecoides x Auxenochlorella symbiontica]
MHDFCLTLPYALLVAVRELIRWLASPSTAHIGQGLGSAAALGFLGYTSLKAYKQGRRAHVTAVLSLVLAAALLSRTLTASGLGSLAGALSILSDGGMAAFYVWNLTLFHPKLPLPKE